MDELVQHLVPPHREFAKMLDQRGLVAILEGDGLQIESRTERVLALTGQNHRAHVVALFRAVEGGERLLHAEQIHRIRHPGQIERDGGDAICLHLEADMLVVLLSHRGSLVVCRRRRLYLRARQPGQIRCQSTVSSSRRHGASTHPR